MTDSSPPGRDQPPRTWVGYETAWQIDPDHYVMWADSRGWTRIEGGQLVTAEAAQGVMEWHWDRVGERWCSGFVRFAPGKHRLISASPLHIEPSLLCNRCPDHGWIRNGAWTSA
jgi:hypothetical protein